MSKLRLGYDLTLEQSQKLIMTPELRQAIQMLQYTSLELNEYLSKEIIENPMLELEMPKMETESLETYESTKDIDWKEYLEKYDDISYKTEYDRNKNEYTFESFVSDSPTLIDHLISQLSLISMGVREFKLGEYIIQNINDNGYLISSLEEIANNTQSNLIEVETLLKIIQSFDPLGVGARNLQECLMLQVSDTNNTLVKDLIENHLEDIASNRMNKIAKEKDIDLVDLQVACDFIKGLEPKPGRLISGNLRDVKYVIPDATIQNIDGEYIIIINDSTGPRLNINNFYKGLIKKDQDDETTKFLQDKLNSAVWIIRSIEQRKQTIYKVVESILKFQRDFFDKGDKHLIPLNLKDVAEDIEMHESTISRATNGKYVQTPRGLFELKYFFTSGLSSSEGDVSSTGVKSQIKDIVDGEDIKKPFSDQKISDILRERGTIISRRTVAKYRDELNIASSSLRRRY